MTATQTFRVDGAVYSLAIKSPCVAVSNANLTLSGEQTVNSVAVVEEDRVLVKDQTDTTENGIYVVETGAWGRAKDFDGNRDIVDGTLVTVAKTTGMNFFYQVDATDPIVIGTSSIAFLLASDPNVSFPIIQAEIDAGLTTSDISDSYPPYNILRYGTNTTPGTTDMTTAIQNAIDVGAGRVVTMPTEAGICLHNTKITLPNSNTTLAFEQGASLKAGAVMTTQLEMGDGTNLRSKIRIKNPVLDGDSKASYGITDIGCRLSEISDGWFTNMIEYQILQQPTTALFSDFLEISRCNGFDGKGFFKMLATASSRATDTILRDNLQFRATEWFAHIDNGQRFKFYDNYVGSQTATYLGGINIVCTDTLTATDVPIEHDIRGLYVESSTTHAPAVSTGTHDGSSNVAILADSGESWTVNEHVGRTLINVTDGSSAIVTANDATTITGALTGGTDDDWDASDSYEILGIIAVQIYNESTTKTVGGISIDKVVTQPGSRVTLCNIRSPVTASSLRNITITGIDNKSTFSNAITVGNGVVWTRINSNNWQGTASAAITDRGTHTVINNLKEAASGKATAPTSGDPGDLIRNTSDDGFWTMDSAGNYLQVGHGTIYFSETRNLADVASGALVPEFDVTITGATLGDFCQLSHSIDTLGLMLNANVTATDTVTVTGWNPTAGAQNMANGTWYYLVTKR